VGKDEIQWLEEAKCRLRRIIKICKHKNNRIITKEKWDRRKQNINGKFNTRC
jgi:hypothetical protein